jgi:hypothetical protein
MVQNSIQSLFGICAGLDNRLSEQRKRIDSLEQRQGRLIEEVKTENKALLERVGRLESLEQRPGRLLEEVRTGNRALLERVDELEPGEKVPLPPLGQGILRFLKERNYIVQITVSSHFNGGTDNLLTEDDSWWSSGDEPNSWIQWTITSGLKAIISCAKIRGRPPFSGVKDFIIEGSNDGAVWTRIIDSKTCPTTFKNFFTQADALRQPQRSFSIIRLTQTGPRFCPESANNHYLALTYVDFSGRVIFPKTAK